MNKAAKVVRLISGMMGWLLFVKTLGVRADTIYVGNEVGHTIEEFTQSGSGSLFVNDGGPYGLAFDSAGNLYASDYGADVILEFNSNGVKSVFTTTGLNEPYGLAFDSSGNLYAANNGNNSVEKFTTDGVGSVFATNGLSG